MLENQKLQDNIKNLKLNSDAEFRILAHTFQKLAYTMGDFISVIILALDWSTTIVSMGHACGQMVALEDGRLHGISKGRVS